jgi:hypothetical protein
MTPRKVNATLRRHQRTIKKELVRKDSTADLNAILAKVEAAAELMRSQYSHVIRQGCIGMSNALVEIARALAASSPKE